MEVDTSTVALIGPTLEAIDPRPDCGGAALDLNADFSKLVGVLGERDSGRYGERLPTGDVVKKFGQRRAGSESLGTHEGIDVPVR